MVLPAGRLDPPRSLFYTSAMATTYNQVAGRSLERIAALSDGVFAFAMTLIVLDIRIPELALIHSENDLIAALISLAPRMVTYLMSFLTLGIFWVGQQVQLSHLEKSDRHLTWLHLLYLAFVAMIPLSTRLLAGFIGYRTALLIYWANLLLLGIVVYACWAYACKAKLVKKEARKGDYLLLQRRILTAQAFYAFGAALCFFDPALSIGFIVLIQLNYAAAPRIPFLSKL